MDIVVSHQFMNLENKQTKFYKNVFCLVLHDIKSPAIMMLVAIGYWCLNLSSGCWWSQGAGVSTCHQGVGGHRVVVSQPVTRVLVAQPQPVTRVLVSTGCWCLNLSPGCRWPPGAGVSACLQCIGDSVLACLQGTGGMPQPVSRVLVSQPVSRVLVAQPQPVSRVLVACLSLSPGYWWLSLSLSPGYW